MTYTIRASSFFVLPGSTIGPRSHCRGRGRSLDCSSIKEEHPVKSLLLATALLGSVSVPVVDLPKELPADGPSDATAPVHLMLAKGPGGSGPSRGRASKGSSSSQGAGGYTGNTGEGGYRGSSGANDSNSANQQTPNEPRNLPSSPPGPLGAPPAAPPAGNSR